MVLLIGGPVLSPPVLKACIVNLLSQQRPEGGDVLCDNDTPSSLELTTVGDIKGKKLKLVPEA